MAVNAMRQFPCFERSGYIRRSVVAVFWPFAILVA